MLFMKRLEFSFADFIVWSFKTSVEYGFLYNPPVEWNVNSMEQKTRVFCQIYVQEFYLKSFSGEPHPGGEGDREEDQAGGGAAHAPHHLFLSHNPSTTTQGLTLNVGCCEKKIAMPSLRCYRL
jgi:hypothetical protein